MEAELPRDESASEPVSFVASLENLTGPSSGTVCWLRDPVLEVSLSPRRHIHVSAAIPGRSNPDLVAYLHGFEDGYEIGVAEGKKIWVNKQPIVTKRLQHLDMIEFGESGPMSRYYLHRTGGLTHLSATDIVSDAAAYFRNSRRSLGRRILNTVLQVFSRLALETTIVFRIGVVVALCALAGLAYQQNRLNMLLQQQIETGTAQLENFSRILALSRKDALTPGDLETLSQELGSRIETTAGRVLELERLSTATARVISASKSSIVFLQGAYGLKSAITDQMLRHVVDEEGQPLLLPNGVPLLSLDGKGTVAERQFIGTGFIIGESGFVVTNRHVGLPWEYDADVKSLVEHGLNPVMIKFVAYRPGVENAETIELVKASEAADLAILRYTAGGGHVTGLRLAEKSPEPGDEVIVMGYPTGLRSMLVQAGEEIVEELQKTKNIGFWSVAERLSRSGLIAPLASRGIVGRISDEFVVYDAETTHGGSGGPVLDTKGSVVAVNAAIMPGYGGSNFGVPIEKVRELLSSVDSL